MNKFILFGAFLAVCISAHSINDLLDKHHQSRDHFVYEPNPLPCSVQVTVKSEYQQGSSRMVQIFDHYLHNKTYYLLDLKAKTDGVASGETYFLLRGDLKNETTGGAKAFSYESSAHSSERCDGSNDTSLDFIDGILDMYLPYLTKEMSFDEKEDGEYKGKKCILYTQIGTYNITYYIDSDNWPIYIEITADGKTQQVTTLEYNFNVPLSVFAIGSEYSTKCPEESSGMTTAPTDFLCPIPSSSTTPSVPSTSTAATLSVGFAMIMLSIATALSFYLF